VTRKVSFVGRAIAEFRDPVMHGFGGRVWYLRLFAVGWGCMAVVDSR
jgi:hypothetical protein